MCEGTESTEGQTEDTVDIDMLLASAAEDLDQAWRKHMLTRFLEDAKECGDDERIKILNSMLDEPNNNG